MSNLRRRAGEKKNIRQYLEGKASVKRLYPAIENKILNTIELCWVVKWAILAMIPRIHSGDEFCNNLVSVSPFCFLKVMK